MTIDQEILSELREEDALGALYRELVETFLNVGYCAMAKKIRALEQRVQQLESEKADLKKRILASLDDEQSCDPGCPCHREVSE